MFRLNAILYLGAQKSLLLNSCETDEIKANMSTDCGYRIQDLYKSAFYLPESCYKIKRLKYLFVVSGYVCGRHEGAEKKKTNQILHILTAQSENKTLK